jgi:PPOX class probable FMN-dependent enzyme
MKIDSLEALRGLYAAPTERAVRKEIRSLDVHCRRFIGLSPFVVLATADREGRADASPRGGAPGFVKVADDRTVLVPDAPGNNRLDTLENILATGRIGMLFMIPGVDETLRVNGRASLSGDPADIAFCKNEKRQPKLAIRVAVESAYLHCAKAFMRSGLWKAASQVDRAALPTIGQMIADQTGLQAPPETR